MLVAPGEYVITEPVTFRGEAITVRSEAGRDQTTIHMSDTPIDPCEATVVLFEHGETEASVFEGFTLTGGRGCWRTDRDPPEDPGVWRQQWRWVGGGRINRVKRFHKRFFRKKLGKIFKLCVIIGSFSRCYKRRSGKAAHNGELPIIVRVVVVRGAHSSPSGQKGSCGMNWLNVDRMRLLCVGIVFCLTFALPQFLAAQTGKNDPEFAGLTAAGPRLGPGVVVEVTFPDREALDELARAGYDISNVQGNVATIYASLEELERLKQTGYPLREIKPRTQGFDIMDLGS